MDITMTQTFERNNCSDNKIGLKNRHRTLWNEFLHSQLSTRLSLDGTADQGFVE